MTKNILLKDRFPVVDSGANIFKPLFFRLSDQSQKIKLDALISVTPGIRIFDQIESQVIELLKIRNPAKPLTDKQKQVALSALHDPGSDLYGVWVYYPWSAYLLHILDEQEFFELRTSRNKYKITADEQILLARKKTGIIGLSVGQAIAITMTIERLFGEVRLADFDDLELSNMNRLRAGLHDLGTSKVLIAAREIAEIDPFIKVVPYFEGITASNIDDFLTLEGNLDVLVEECDSMDIKIFSRLKAREYGIPVVMDTNDRGMLDIERFDLEPDRPILHGLIEHLPMKDLDQLKNLSNQEKLPYLAPMVGIEKISERLRNSVPEIGKTITTWPQLASSVVLGSAMVADTCRRIFLNEFTKSGRFYLDFEEIIS